jgi:hypothetical protein
VRYNAMTMTKYATFSAIVLIGLLTAACSSSSQTSLDSRATSSPTGSAVATTAAPSPEALATSQPEVAPSQSRAVAPPSLAPNRCPAINANPVGCPGPLPPQPITPQSGHARILLCSQPIVAAVPPTTAGAILCGAGFHPEESVTITVTGRTGSTSWQVVARSDGTFRSVLPAAACRLMPANVIARGNQGSVSNAASLSYSACHQVR